MARNDPAFGTAPARPPDEGRRRIIVNASLNVLGQLVYVALQLCVVFLLARGLGTSAIGEYYTLFAAVLIVQLTVEGGVGTVVTRQIAQRLDQADQLQAFSLGLFAVIAVVSFLACVACGMLWIQWIGRPDLLPVIIAAGVTCAAIQIQRFATAVFHAVERVGFENAMHVFQGLLYLATLAGLVWTQRASLGNVFSALALSHAMTSAAALYKLRSRHGLRIRMDSTMAWTWWRSAVPLGCGDVVRKLTWQIDTIALALLQPPAVVGIYSIAYRPLGPLNWIPRTILAAAFPALARSAAANHRELADGFSRGTRVLLLIGIPIAISLHAMAAPLILGLAGDEFRGAIPVFRFLIWVVIFSFVSQQFRFLLAALNRQATFSRLAAIVLSVKIPLQALLIFYAGCFGACMGTLLTEILFAALGMISLHNLGIARLPYRESAICAFAGCAMAAVTWIGHGLSSAQFAVWLVAANGVYFSLCLALGAIPQDEVQAVLQIVRSGSRQRPQLTT